MLRSLKPRSEFSRNVLTLMTGTTIAQAIPIAISPILTRIYTPEDFGVFALFVAITAIFASVVNGQYEYVIMLPNKDEDAINIFALGFIINFFISFILFILIVFCNDYFIAFLGNEEISFWLYFVPITVFFTGLWNMLNYFNNRKKYYKDIAKTIIIKSLVLAIIQLSVGFIKQGATGLITGQIISSIFANVQLLKNIIKDRLLLKKISKVKIIALSKKYKNFPIISTWASLTNTLSGQLTNILLSTLYCVATLGFYSLVQRVLGMPSSLIGNAIGQVFFQQATNEKQKTGKAIQTFTSTIKKLTIVGILLFGLLFFIIEDLFIFIFGEKWEVAGVYAQLLIPLFFIRFLSSTVSMINTVFEKNKNGVIINVLLLVTALSIIYFAHMSKMDEQSFFRLFSWVMSVEYLIFLVYYYNLAKGKYEKITH